MKENSIEEDIKILEEFIEGLKQYNPKTGKDIKPTQFGEGQRYVYSDVYYAIEHILLDYKRVLKENKTLNKKIDLMENYMVENGWEICFDNIYAELNNCNGMERDWCRGDKLEKEDIHKYFNKKLLESE